MDVTAQTKTTGSYTPNLLGNIRSHLAGLQCYDVMSLELIQNVADLRADKFGAGHKLGADRIERVAIVLFHG